MNNMNKKLLFSLCFGLLLLPLSWSATKGTPPSELSDLLSKLGATNITIKESKLAGFKTAVTDQGIVYISNDGQFLIHGKIFALKDKQLVDLSSDLLFQELSTLRDQMIVYPAKNEKYRVTAFVDISCHYCHLLHSKIKEYNDLGITIQYLAFPRAGLNSEVAQKMEAIWQSKDPLTAYNEAEKDHFPLTRPHPNIIKKHYQLGVQFGVTGTPNLVLPNGELIKGYVEPQQLQQILNETFAQ